VAWKRRRLARALSKADRVTAVSRFELDAVENCGIPVRHKSVLIPNGIELAEFRDVTAATAAPKGSFNLLFPGGARFVKGGDLLLKALPRVKRHIPDIHVYVTGRVPLNHVMRKLVAGDDLAGNVSFLGFLSTTEYRQLLKAADAIVMPSREEGMPLALLEAMALAKPIIACNTGGIPELIDNGRNGLLVEPEPSQIADAIVLLHEREDVRRTIVRNGSNYVTAFDWGNISTQYIALYVEAREALLPRRLH
jgi:glycosyltransferase involved in cell wall biosynthesis